MPDFQNPAAFLLFFLIPLFYLFRKTGILKKISFPLTLSDWGGRTFQWRGTLYTFCERLSNIFCIAGFAAAVIALADPVIHHDERVYTSRGTDIMFVLDTSPSMAAKDIAGMSRLDAARRAIHTLAEQNKGASFGLVTMASDAAVVVPPTVDRTVFLDRLDKAVVGELGNGSAIGTGLSTAVYHLISSSAPKKCIVLITDGENNAGAIHPETAAELAGNKGITLYTLGVGTKGTVPLEYVDPATGKVYSGYLESAFDPRPLERIAAAAGGRYFNVESTASLRTALSSIDRREKTVQTYHLRAADAYYYSEFVMAAAIAFALAWIIRRFILKGVA